MILIVVITTRKRTAGTERSLSDIILARVKIVVSFYQISTGTMDAFSYVKWPGPLIKMSQYAKFVQLNILQIAPLHCFNARLKMSAYHDLVITCSLTVGVVLTALLCYNLKRLYLSRSSNRYSKTKIESILEESKEIYYRNVFLFIFVTYPNTCSTIFDVLPPACHKVCQDIKETKCNFYLKKDYSLQCFTEKYNRYVILAYFASIYPFAVPILTAVVLWKYHFKTGLKVENDNTDQFVGQIQPEQKTEHDQETILDKKCRTVDRTNKDQSKTHDRKECNLKQGSVSVDDFQPVRTESVEIQTTEHDQETILNKKCKTVDHTDKDQSKTHDGKECNLKQESVSVDVLQPVRTDSVEIRHLEIIPEERERPNVVCATKQVSRKSSSEDKERKTSPRTPVPVVAAMSFLYENYAENCWYWEIIEMTRKLLMTSSLALIGAEGRNSLGVASMLSG